MQLLLEERWVQTKVIVKFEWMRYLGKCFRLRKHFKCGIMPRPAYHQPPSICAAAPPRVQNSVKVKNDIWIINYPAQRASRQCREKTFCVSACEQILYQQDGSELLPRACGGGNWLKRALTAPSAALISRMMNFCVLRAMKKPSTRTQIAVRIRWG